MAESRDRRPSSIALTPAGAAALAAADVVFERELARLLDAVLSPTALARFAGTLGRVRAAL